MSGEAVFDKVVELGAGAEADTDFSLLEVLDHVLNSGVVIQGSFVISLAGVDLIYVGLSAVVSSIETAIKSARPLPAPPKR